MDFFYENVTHNLGSARGQPEVDPRSTRDFFCEVGLCTKWGSGLKSRAPGGYTQNVILCRMVKPIGPYLK